MAGGKSARMRAGGCDTHKALREICGLTLLERNLHWLVNSGIHDLWVAINDSETELSAWIDSQGVPLAESAGSVLGTLREYSPLGTIGAARLLTSCGKNIVVVNVDNLCDLDIRALVDFHLRQSASLTLATHRATFRIPFGQIVNHGARLMEYCEKPTFAVTVSSGIYVLHQRALQYITPNARTDTPCLVKRLVGSGELVACFQHSASWIDVNDEAALAQAQTLLAPMAV